MCLGDFLLPEAPMVIIVEEALSSAVQLLFEIQQHFALQTLPEITARAATTVGSFTEKSIISFLSSEKKNVTRLLSS